MMSVHDDVRARGVVLLPFIIPNSSPPPMRLVLVVRQHKHHITSTKSQNIRANTMGFLQVGFEVTRLPEDTNMSTPMFVDANNMANTNGEYIHKHPKCSFLNPKAWHKIN